MKDRTLIREDSPDLLVIEQTNQLSGALLGGAIYGFTKKENKDLREPNSSRVQAAHVDTTSIYIDLPTKEELDTSEKRKIWTDFFVADKGHNDRGYETRISGDNRVMQNPYLASFHIIFHRLHNILVEMLQKIQWVLKANDLKPDWIYEEARKINIAVMQSRDVNLSGPAQK